MNSEYWITDGTHICTIVDVQSGQHNNAAKDKYVHFVLENAEHRRCNKRFVVTPNAMRAIRSFGHACGLSLAEIKVPTRKDFVGKSVEVDVTTNDDGYPVIDR